MLKLKTNSKFNLDYEKKPLVYRIADNGPPLLKQIFMEKGWEEYIQGSTAYWNFFWKSSRFPQSVHDHCNKHQRINHFGNTTTLTKKDCLFRLLKTMKVIYGSIYDFFPLTFTLPNEYVKFVKAYAADEELNQKKLWICKPVDMSRGRGIFLVKDLKDCIYDTNAIIQVYIERPLLISGYKFDLRCYVVVRSFNPLVVYIYNEGMARFATNKYNTTDIKDVFSHLTNTSINKFSPTLQNEKEEIGPGCKWTLNTLNSFLKLKGINFDEIFKKIKAIILYTIIPITNDVILHSYSCFELFGFDIIIDQNLKPCLLEVNLSPALSVDSSIDIEVKKPLLSDIISMMNYTESDGDLAFVAEENLHLNKRKNSASSTKTKEQNAKERNSFNFASEVGKFEMIYPFNELTKKHSNLKVGQPVTREILQQIRKKYS